MAFNFPAFTYIVALIIDVCLIFFAIFHVIAFDELKTDYKNPIDQCNSLNPLVVPEYLLHLLFNILFIASGEWFSLCLNIPLIAYHIKRIPPLCTFLSSFLMCHMVDYTSLPTIFPGSCENMKLDSNTYRSRPVMTGAGLYDPTSIMNADVLAKCQREGWVKLAFYLLSFFYYLYGMIYSLITT